MDLSTAPHLPARARVIVIGAGIAGLAASVRLAAAGLRVTLLERHAHAGGKIRTMPSDAGPVDAGPTVLTMRHVFDDLFAAAGARLEDHVTLIAQDVLARHFWPDGSTLDLTTDHGANAAAIERFACKTVALEYERFTRDAAELFDDLRDELEIMAPVARSEVESAQEEIVKSALTLNEEGTIRLPFGGDDDMV